MPHPLIAQLRFTRREWLRGLNGVSEEDAARHLGPMNCISWIAGHLAWHEHRYWIERGLGQLLYPVLDRDFAYGAAMSTPSLAAMLAIWHAVIAAADPYLDTLTTASLQAELPIAGHFARQSAGSAVQRVTYHYWYHIGEVQAIRQLLGHQQLPEYVGAIEQEASYRPE